MKAKRAYLSPNERAAMLERQGQACFTWGCTGKPVVAEHWVCVALGNDQKPDCILCRDCASAKTKRDLASIAKVKRIRHGKTQYDKRKLKGSKLRGRGFDKTLRKKMDGTVEKRR